MDVSKSDDLSLEQIDTESLASEIIKHASESRNEEELKIRVESTLRPILEKWGIKWASYEKSHRISGTRKDALYGHVIIEYKAPGKLDNKAEFSKAREQVKRYLKEAAVDDKYLGRYFGIIIDGRKIAFTRFRKNEWEEQEEPLEVNPQTILRLIESIGGLRRKPLDAELLLLEFGPKSEVSRKAILALYESIADKNTERTDMLFNDWKRVFSQVCSYSADKLSALIDYYRLSGSKNVDVEKLLYSIHTYYTILMKLLTSEIVTLFADSLLGSYLKRIEEAYYRSKEEMLRELRDLEEGGIFLQIGIRNFLEADYFGWYLDEWNDKVALSVFGLAKRLLDYEPATVELSPERVKDLFKRLYQGLVPRDIRHSLGEYFTPDWLAELLLDEVGYDGNPEKRVLDPACGSGTFLVLTIRRLKEYADEHFLDRRDVLKKVIENVKGIDLNPLAVLASKANYLIALSDLIRYRPRDGIEIPVYLADSISVVRKATVYGEDEFELNTNEGKFWVTKEVIDKNYLYPVLSLISQGIKVGWTEKELEKSLSQKIPLSRQSVESFIRLYAKIWKLEKYGKDKIWTSLLKNSFSPMLMGKFDYVIGNPPWINWESLPEFYRNSTKQFWEDYGLFEKTKGGGLGKVNRDIATLFTARCFSQYATEDGVLGFLLPFNVLRSQGGAGFRNYLTNKTEIIRVHELSELYPFEGAVNRTGLIAIRHGRTKFPIPCLMWSNAGGKAINMEEELPTVRKITKQYDFILAPVVKGKPISPWMVTSNKTYGPMKRIVKPSEYLSNVGSYTALSGVYWIDILSDEPNGLMIRNAATSGLKKKVSIVTGVVERDLVYPLVRGRDVRRWHAAPAGYIILPHDPETGKPIQENEMRTNYQRTYKFFLDFRKELEERPIHRLWGGSNPFYSVYDMGDYTFKPYKVVYKDISGKISAKGEFGGASVVASVKDKYLGEKLIIPDNTLMVIACESVEEAYYLSAILNSTIVRFIATTSTVLHLRGHIMKYIGIKRFAPAETVHQLLSSLSKRAHELGRRYYEEKDLTARSELGRIEEQIDKAVAGLYGISDEEMDEFKRTLIILKEGA